MNIICYDYMRTNTCAINQSINQLAFISYIVVYRPFQKLIKYSCHVNVLISKSTSLAVHFNQEISNSPIMYHLMGLIS